VALFLSTDEYFACTSVAIFSLLQTRPEAGVVLFITENVDPKLSEALSLAFPSVKIHHVEVILNPNPEQEIEADKVLFNFTKWRIWQLDSDTVIYFDSDFLIVRSINSLCHLNSEISAVNNFDSNKLEYSSSFNAGFLVIKPNIETLIKMLNFSSTFISRKGGDQAAINSYFKGRIEEIPFDFASNANSWKSSKHLWRPESVHSFHMTREFNPCVRSYSYYLDNLALYHAGKLDPDHPHFLWIETFYRLQENHPNLVPFIEETFRKKHL